MKENNNTIPFSERLQTFRMQQGWSQLQLATHLGTTKMTIYRWERGKTQPRNTYLRKQLCSLFACTEEDLEITILKHQRDERIVDPYLPKEGEILIGRESSLAVIKAQFLRNRNPGTIVVQGLPGVGKTSLMAMLAHDEDICHHFSDGILWAGVGPRPDQHKLLERWASLLQLPPQQSFADLQERIKEVLADKSMLCILDDVWKFEDIFPLIIGGPRCTYVLTTRFPDVAIQTTNDNDHIIHISELSKQESIQLLAHLAPELNTDDDEVMSSLVASVGGLPLALRLIGNYLRLHTRSNRPRRLHFALEHLHSAEARLSLMQPEDFISNHSLKHILDEVCMPLPEHARQTLYAIAAFPAKPNSFSEEALQAITHCSIETVDLLYDMGLVESLDNERCCLHQVVADYAYLYLNKEREHEIQQNSIIYYTNFLRRHRQDYECIEREHTNIQSMLEVTYQLQGDLYSAVTLLMPYLLARGLYEYAEQQLSRVQACLSSSGSEEEHATICHFLGQVAQKKGLFQQAADSFQSGLHFARQLPHASRTLALLADLGWVTWKAGQYREAESYLQEGLQLVHRSQDRAQHCKILRVLGSVYHSLGEARRATHFLQEALQLARQTKDHEQTCIILLNLGSSDYLALQQEIRLLKEALSIAQRLQHREWISLACLDLSDRYIQQRRYEQSAAFTYEGLHLARMMGQREWIAAHQINLGIILREQGNFHQAQNAFEEALHIARRLGRPFVIGSVLYEYSILCIRAHELAQAEALLKDMKHILSPDDPNLHAYWSFGMAQLYAVQQDPRADEMSQQSLQLFTTIENKMGMDHVEQWLRHQATNVDT